MNKQEIKEEKEKLEKLSKTYSMGSDGWNSVISALTRIVLEEFNTNSAKYSEKLITLTNWLIGLSVAMLIAIIFQIYLTVQQTNYVELQSRSERILQTQRIQKAIELCEQSPKLMESGLFEVSTGKPAPCAQVLQQYKNGSY